MTELERALRALCRSAAQVIAAYRALPDEVRDLPARIERDFAEWEREYQDEHDDR
jgi:hypothetical protein